MKKKDTHIVYGFVTGLIMVVIGLALYLTGLAFKPGMAYVSQIPFLVGIMMNAMAFSKANDGFVTFGNVFGSGFRMSMIVTLVMLAWGIITIFIFPEMKEKAVAMARDKMMQDNKMTDEQIEMALGWTRKYFNVFVIAGTIFSQLLYGAIFSLIGAAVAKKKGAQPFQADTF